jgi:hypothetical protein
MKNSRSNIIIKWNIKSSGHLSPTHKVQGKCTLVQSLRVHTGHTAHRGSTGIALPFHDHGTRRGWGVSIAPRPLFTPGKDPVLIVQKAGWAPGPVWTGAKNLAPTRIWCPDHPAHSQSLYRLSYPDHTNTQVAFKTGIGYRTCTSTDDGNRKNVDKVRKPVKIFCCLHIRMTAEELNMDQKTDKS